MIPGGRLLRRSSIAAETDLLSNRHPGPAVPPAFVFAEPARITSVASTWRRPGIARCGTSRRLTSSPDRTDEACDEPRGDRSPYRGEGGRNGGGVVQRVDGMVVRHLV